MKLTCAWHMRGILACTLLSAALAFTGCSSRALDPTFFDSPTSPLDGNSPAASNSVARFHIGDTVIVTLTGLPQEITPTPHQEAIKEDGTIEMPDIGKVQAAGKTAGELQNEIHDMYVPKYYTHITVTVTTGDLVYYVGGEVKAPNRYVYSGQTTVTKAIQTANDFTDFANHKNVTLIRASGQHIKVNVDRILSGKIPDLPVYPGDQVFVHRRIW